MQANINDVSGKKSYFSIEEVGEIIAAKSQIAFAQEKVVHLCLDSRTARADGSLFIAITGERHDGHDYIPQLYEQGFRSFVVEKLPANSSKISANFLVVENSVVALQKLASYHRKQFSYPVIGISGSNGKTIVKEWLSQLLAPFFRVVKSPRSYNSQVGVPLSLWEMQAWHELAIIEAGISKPEEMAKLEQIIQPTIGILTNIGEAHSSGFASKAKKLEEKMLLFTQVEKFIFCADDPEILNSAKLLKNKPELWSWSLNEAPTAKLHFGCITENGLSKISYRYGTMREISLPFADLASRENALHCLATMLMLGLQPNQIEQAFSTLEPLEMRMELLRGTAGKLLINDAYSNDLGSLKLALEFLNAEAEAPKALILSDIPETNLADETIYAQVYKLIEQANISLVLTVGKTAGAQLAKFLKQGGPELLEFPDTKALLDGLNKLSESSQLSNFDILIKGARKFQFERIVRRLEAQVHSTVLEVNLTAIEHNLNTYRQHLSSSVAEKQAAPKIMAMVKALSYGSGQKEVARLLEYNRVDYLAVAYPDEGYALRREGINLPIMVMNAERGNLRSMFRARLEPEIYALDQLVNFDQEGSFPIHLKLDTGMHRLGFAENQLDELIQFLKDKPHFQVRSIFSHLSSADEPEQDDYSRQQIGLFERMSGRICNALEQTENSNNSEPSRKILRHLLNSSGSLRFPEARFDMVRLGIGLYGYDPTGLISGQLKTVSRLRTTVSQIKDVPKGETVGYNREGLAEKQLRIATIGIGYADGFRRVLGKGNGFVSIHGKIAAVVGNVCMDMCMVDITDIPEVRVGDEAEVFGPSISLENYSAKMGTIPYEALTSVSARVKRVFFRE